MSTERISFGEILARTIQVRRTLKPLLVIGCRPVIKEFECAAIAAFPNEKWGALIGHRDGQTIRVIDAFVPDRNGATEELPVSLLNGWFLAADEHAREISAEVVGDIHSHPWTWAEIQKWSSGPPERQQSESDLGYAPGWDALAGVTNVLQNKRGKLRASTRIWGPMVPVKIAAEKREDKCKQVKACRSTKFQR